MCNSENSEHLKLANTIKITHKLLRESAQVLGNEQAWKNHCENKKLLEKYSFAMQELAINYWDNNCKKDSKAYSRILWTYSACIAYFSNIQKFRDKELKILKHCFNLENSNLKFHEINAKFKLLDVGSCYNPFNKFEEFDVIAIDIAPANNTVFKCDFLNLPILDKTLIENYSVNQLEENSFHIIIFSLLLEYFPSSQQRFECCLNAYKLLKTEGILVIITPDSNHIGTNSKIYKSWQNVLAKIGFMRVKYEKLPHLHCMLFRKAENLMVAQRWAEIHKSEKLYEEIFIPQDFHKTVNSNINGLLLDGNNWNNDTFLNEFN